MKKALIWKLLERFGVLGGQFILQIILARILDPEHYGALSIMVIFTSLANVFIQSGFNTALIQNKDVTEKDYSSVFWVSLLIALGLYGVIFFCAPLIATFYGMDYIVTPMRVLALMLLPGALNSVQTAKVSREMDFKKVFYGNLFAVIISGITGIVIAILGGGLWALVAQSVLNVVVSCLVMNLLTKLKIRFICELKRVKVLFSYGWKLLVSALIDTLYQDIRSLVIGKKYDSATLGYYNRGKQFPQFGMNAINGAVQGVMLPALSKDQDNTQEVKKTMRKSITLTSYIVFPMMAGLAGIAPVLISLLLTDKWLPCVPYLQVYCFTMAFYPVHSCNLQAINAVGRSDIFMKLEFIKKGIGIASLVVAVFCFSSPLAIALTGVFTTIISFFINAFPNKKLIKYSWGEQIRDIVPALLMSLCMCACVLLIGQVSMPPIILLVVQVLVGVVAYVVLSIVSKNKSCLEVLNMVKDLFKKNKENKKTMKGLVLAGGFPQIALIKEIKSRGIETVLADWGAEPVAKKYADKFYQVSTLDVNAIKEVAIKENVDFLITACTDQALLTVAKVSEELNLPCYVDYQTALNVTNKEYMKEVFVKHGISTAKHVIVKEYDENLLCDMKYPLIVKPVDCNSSKGVKRVENVEELKKAIKEAVNFSRTDTAVVERFIDGPEISVDVYVEDGVAHVLNIQNNVKIKDKEKFIIFRGFSPAKEKEQIKEKVRLTAQQIADAFGLKNSPMLIQMITDGKDVFVLEFSARTGGGVKYIIIDNMSGFDVIKAVVDLTLGQKPHVEKNKEKTKYMVNDFIYCYPGIFDHLEGFEELKQNGTISDYYLFKSKGAKFETVNSSGDRIAGYSICANTMDELREKHKEAREKLKVIDSEKKDIMRHDLITSID